jgi:hypothetical protein
MTPDPDVAASASASCWSVEERAWKQELPHLSDDVIALLATPVVVTATAFSGRTVPAAPNEAAPDEAEPIEVEPIEVEPIERTRQILAPAPSRGVRRTAGHNLHYRQPARIL